MSTPPADDPSATHPTTDPQQSSSAHMAVFEGQTIRRVWLEDRWYFSVVDVVGLLAQSTEPRKYWSAMKARIHDEGFAQLSTQCRQLKMPSRDGKSYVTDAADTETLLRIIQSIPSPHAEPVKQWLAHVGAERLAELNDPSLAVDRARATYQAQGYAEDWIDKRLQSIVVRQELTDEWRERGAQEGREFARLTDTLHRGTFNVTTNEHKIIKQLRRSHNLRDSMTTLELVLTSLAEVSATELHQAHDSQGFGELHSDAQQAGKLAGDARRQLEEQSGRPVVTSENFKTLTARPAAQQLPLPTEEPEQ